MDFKVDSDCKLLDFLFEQMPDRSRTTVKSFLTHRQVSVNGCAVTQFDAQLQSGDVVSISRERKGVAFHHPMLRIVYEDPYIIVIDKRNGLLSIATDKEQQRTAYYILSDYVKRNNPDAKIFIIHRLDRETSGLMMFALSENVQQTMQHGWHRLVSDRRYVALVEGHLPASEGVIESYLTEDRNRKVWVCREGEGQKAVTYYKVLQSNETNQLVDLKLETGKKNQIRAHLEWLGTPIAGDKKYGAKTNPQGRVCLHAYRLNIVHPVTGEQLNFETRIPQQFEIDK